MTVTAHDRLLAALREAARGSAGRDEVVNALAELLPGQLGEGQLRALLARLSPAGVEKGAGSDHAALVEDLARVRVRVARRALERARALPGISAAALLDAQHTLEAAEDAARVLDAERAHAQLRVRHAREELALEVRAAQAHREYLQLARAGEQDPARRLDIQYTLAGVEDLLSQLPEMPPAPAWPSVRWVDTSPAAWQARLAQHPRAREARRARRQVEAAAAEAHGEVAARVKAREEVRRARQAEAEVQAALRAWLDERLEGLRALRAACEVQWARQRQLLNEAGAAPDPLTASAGRFVLAQHEVALRGALHRYQEAVHELHALLENGA